MEQTLQERFEKRFKNYTYMDYFEINGRKNQVGYSLMRYRFLKDEKSPWVLPGGHISAFRIEEKDGYYAVFEGSDLIAIKNDLDEADKIAYDYIVKETERYQYLYPGIPIMDKTERGNKRERKLEAEALFELLPI